MILSKPLIKLLVLVLLVVALFSQASVVGAHPDSGEDWVNDWLRFSVKNVHFRTVEVTASIIDVDHTTGHGHWPGSYTIIKGDIAPGETKMGHLPDYVSQSGP